VFDALYGEGVLGYYSPARDRIVVVSDEPTPTVDRSTLAHELVHALQDQRLPTVGRADSRDGRLARLGLTEGDAVAVARAYERRCGDGWECLPRPDRSPPSGAIARNQGVYLTVVQPYVSGPAFVDALRERGGWARVNDAYEDPPTSTEQVIHPERYPEDRPVAVELPDRSTDAWQLVARETAGEAAIHTSLWARGQVPRPDDAIRTDYLDPASTGWAGDRLLAYTDGEETAHVWVTEWETTDDAREFVRSYRSMLRVQLPARILGDGRHRIESGPFADAVSIRRSGTRVTVVAAPTTAALDEVAGAQATTTEPHR
jgi:hypothetical protein